MKEIPLTKGYVALVDDEDYPYLSQFKWRAQVRYHTHICAVRSLPWIDGKRNLIYMHREIMKSPDNKLVDHKNGNALDNQKHNLRVCTSSENQMNRGKSKNNTSGFCGVAKNGKGFQANISLNRKRMYLGTYPTIAEAARAYDAAAIKYHGEFARLNYPENNYSYVND